jgi:hypothetical protein
MKINHFKKLTIWSLLVLFRSLTASAQMGKIPITEVSKFQNTDSDATADNKWQLMERIYEIDQKFEYPAIDGRFKKTNS